MRNTLSLKKLSKPLFAALFLALLAVCLLAVTNCSSCEEPHGASNLGESSKPEAGASSEPRKEEPSLEEGTLEDDGREEQAANQQNIAYQASENEAAAPSPSVSHESAGSDKPSVPSASADDGVEHVAVERHWVEDTEGVWVVDSEAWSEQVPIYGTQELSICNVCGADISGNTAAHGKQHMLAGEGSGHHSEFRNEVVGYETVCHDEVGHWETVVVGGHWE